MKFFLASLTSLFFLSSFAIAGDVRGVRIASGYVIPGGSAEFNREFIFQERMVGRIAVIGSNKTDIDCWLYDADGALVDSDTDDTSVCDLVVVPQWTGRFSLVIQNRGTIGSPYTLRTN